MSLVCRNVFNSLLTQLASWVLTFAVTYYLPRYLGATGLGKLAFATSFVGILGVVVPMGTSTVLIKEIARDRSRTGELIVGALAVRLVLAIVVGAGTIGIGVVCRYPATIQALVIVAAFGMVLTMLNDVLASALRGMEDLPRQNLSVLIEKFLTSGITIALVLLRAPLWAIATAAVVGGLASLLVNVAAFQKVWVTLRRPALSTMRFLVVAGMPFVAWTIFRTLYSQTDPVVLKAVTNDATVGWYAVAFRLGGTAMFLPTALMTALLPTLSRLYGENRDEFAVLARRALSLVVLCSMPFALMLICLPEYLVQLLHYPASFAGAVPALRVSGVCVLADSLGAVLGSIVVAADGQSGMARASLGACVLGIPACIAGSYLTHRLWANGAIGALASDAALEVFLILCYVRLVPRSVLGTESAKFLGRCILAGIPVAGCLYLACHTAAGVWALLASAPTYLAACWLFGCLDREYLTLAGNMVRRRLQV